MRALRWTGAAVLGLVGGLLGLVGVLLCVTLLLAPVGILVLGLARRLWRTAGALVVPRQVRHPIEALSDGASDAVADVDDRVRKGGKRLRRSARRTAKRAKRAKREL